LQFGNIAAQNAHLISIEKAIGHQRLAPSGGCRLHCCPVRPALANSMLLYMNIRATDDENAFAIGHIIRNDTSGFKSWTTTIPAIYKLF
jgi:hypothetical protein